eukprot:CAMPEP_0204499996 /NCGR_PEP_ID=MMETSP0471-20130131/96251_1 /ASSEMBLY_ACC=CAM_ASM_000602 /TAXON_ID=2969 /ORGANISM="Oxyrrhis marina" /LENGTH=66 /DNA_ID=CAMNT_0051504583 /DNA_START=51 /DNA_END=251 /DNA_ORIENTATION=-
MSATDPATSLSSSVSGPRSATDKPVPSDVLRMMAAGECGAAGRLPATLCAFRDRAGFDLWSSSSES